MTTPTKPPYREDYLTSEPQQPGQRTAPGELELRQASYNGLRAFASTLTEKVRELDAKERNYEIGRGHSTEILTSTIETYVYAVVQTMLKQREARRRGDD